VPIVYEVPTHLNVEDTIVFGLGAHQLVRLAAAGSLAYLVWDQATMLPAEARLVVAGLLVAAGLLCALLQPGGRPVPPAAAPPPLAAGRAGGRRAGAGWLRLGRAVPGPRLGGARDGIR
jgi:hypothetical protein